VHPTEETAVSDENHDEHRHGRREAALGKAKEIAGVVLHNDELVEEGQLEEDEAAAELARGDHDASTAKRADPERDRAQ
jgi:hypothetical protein